MKLSEAIRLGSVLYAQAFGTLSQARRHGFLGLFGRKVESKCALGAAFAAGECKSRAATKEDGPPVLSFRGDQIMSAGRVIVEVPLDWNVTLWRTATCPLCEKVENCYRLIPHLNDDHRWTRQQIADWLEVYESDQSADTGELIPQNAHASP